MGRNRFLFYLLLIATFVAIVFLFILQNNLIKVSNQSVVSSIVIDRLVMPFEGWVVVMNVNDGFATITSAGPLSVGLYTQMRIYPLPKRPKTGDKIYLYLYRTQKRDLENLGEVKETVARNLLGKPIRGTFIVE